MILLILFQGSLKVSPISLFLNFTQDQNRQLTLHLVEMEFMETHERRLRLRQPVQHSCTVGCLQRALQQIVEFAFSPSRARYCASLCNYQLISFSAEGVSFYCVTKVYRERIILPLNDTVM